MNCTAANDWLDLRDGNSQNSSLIKRLCGEPRPSSSFQTTGNNLFIHMHTDSSDNDRGFLLEYKGKSLFILYAETFTFQAP